MKIITTISLILVWFFLPLFAWSQIEISVQVTADVDEEISVHVYKPIDGRYFYYQNDPLKVTKDQPIVLKMSDADFGVYYFRTKEKGYYLYVEPGNQLKITIEKNEKNVSSVRFEGDNAAGHQVYTHFVRPSYQYTAESFLNTFANPDEAGKQILRSMHHDLDQIDSILHLKKINNSYAAWAKASTETYFRAVWMHTQWDRRASLQKKAKQNVLDRHEIVQYVDLCKEVLADYDFSNLINSRSEHFISLLNEKAGSLDYIVDTGQMVMREGVGMPISNVSYGEYLYTKAREYAKPTEFRELQLATALSNGLQQNNYEASLIAFYEEFQKAYSHSIYASLLAPKVEEFKDYHVKVANDFSSEMHFVPAYEKMDSFDEILNWSKGKTVYVDMWATWCSPCKAEFAYGGPLKEFARSQGVEILYISIDKPELEQKWKEMIKFYELEGHHLLASPQLSKDIQSKFSEKYQGQQIFSIPQYLILKDGHIMDTNAPRPSRGQALFERLKML